MNRARTAEAKLLRQEQILTAGMELLLHEDYEHVTMASVAAAAGVAKGTPYLYWTTKEALFLDAARVAYRRLFEDIADAVRAAAPDVRPLADAVVDALQANPRVMPLLGLVHSVLERNAPVETVIAFKREILSGMANTAQAMSSRVPWLAPAASTQLLMRVYLALVALQQFAEHGETVKRALEEPDLAALRVDFEAELRELVYDLLVAAKARGTDG